MTKPLTVDEIRNRIVRVERIRFGDVTNHSRNPRVHGNNQRNAFRGAVRELGFGTVPVAYVNGGGTLTWCDGHLRGSELAEYIGEVAITDFTDDEVSKFLLYADPIAAMAEYEAERLDSLLRDVQTGDESLQAMLAGMAEEAGLYQDKPTVNDALPQVDKAEELRQKWGVQTGALWQLGDHRLVCGDCTDKATVERLMGGEKAALVVTDPPYGVEYADKNKFLNAISPGNRIQTPIENDHGDKKDIQETWKNAFGQMSAVMRPGAVVYCFMPQGGDQMMMMMMMMMMGAGIEPRHELIWLKNNHVLGRVDYAYKHEPILYAWKEGGHKFYGDFQTSVIECKKPQKSDLHPTTKPLELIEVLVKNSSLAGEVVYDPFVGSGTTLMACESLGRKARCAELSPSYASVVLERWHVATNRQPVRV